MQGGNDGAVLEIRAGTRKKFLCSNSKLPYFDFHLLFIRHFKNMQYKWILIWEGNTGPIRGKGRGDRWQWGGCDPTSRE